MGYSWETRNIETVAQSALIDSLGKAAGETRFGMYTTARKKVFSDVLPGIGKIQPDLTDHSAEHVKNVLDNAYELLGDSIKELNGIELYCLILSILFHDVGNIFGRVEHEKHIMPIYDYVRPAVSGSEDYEEKAIIFEICKAHGGKGYDKSQDTLQFVREYSDLDRKRVRPRLLASLLRLADELAEGKQRTCDYMIKACQYDEESMPYHQYANCSRISIAREMERIALSFHISLSMNTEGENNHNNGRIIPINELESFLPFIYRRIDKLDLERKYTKHYCELLNPFKRTEVSFNFWFEGRPLPTFLQKVELSDLVVPGDTQKTFEERYEIYVPTNLTNLLRDAIIDMGDPGG